MKFKYFKKIIACVLSLVIVASSISHFTDFVEAESFDLTAPVIEIDSTQDLIEIAKASRGIDGARRDFNGQTIRLIKDITIDNSMVQDSGIGVLTIGKSGEPFKGTLDGNFHTIKGLKNEKSIFPDHNIGLFAEIENAVIKNVTLEEAIVDAAYEAGIVVGEAKYSTIENVIVKNSKLKVQPANNVVSLITNLGTNGGAIAGKTKGSYFYNCESFNTIVYNNTTSGVTGVGGERLDLGGIVGYATEGTIIEYCRVLGGKIRNDYDIAVGALGGKELMTGGIVGEMSDGVKIIDCFSNTKVSFKAANYVAVGSGIAGYAGGIAGVVYGSGNEIIRSHFAGTMDSYQYNAVLVIPIIQKDVNLSGIIERRALNSDIKIDNSYYRQDTLNTDNNSAVKVTGFSDGLTINNSKALNGSEYENKDLWKNSNYDFFAEIERTNDKNKEPHENQWIMDYDMKMPIHGHSLSATFDFPESSEIRLSKEYIGFEWPDGSEENNSSEGLTPVNKKQNISTNNPYQFAVMGFDTYQKEITLTANTNTHADGFSETEEPYKFSGWYSKPDGYKGDSIPENPGFFKDVIVDENNIVSQKEEYTLELDKENNTLNNNELYVAHYQGKVILHNVNGEEISSKYYNYMEEIPLNIPEAPEGCTFYGWTTIPKDGNKGYEVITSDELSKIKSKNELYFIGDSIKKPMKLYPIYTNYISNVKIEVEGYNVEDPMNTDQTNRPNVASATVVKDSETDKLSIELTGAQDGNLPDGFRFLGWYENGKRVSKNQSYSLENVDLTEEHSYTARFEYRVDYMTNLDQVKDNPESYDVFATIWKMYNESFETIDGPETYYAYVGHWGVRKVIHKDGDNSDSYTGIINKPIKVYGHVSLKDNGNGGKNHTAYVSTDFPKSADVTVEWSGLGLIAKGNLKLENLKEGFNFKFWTIEDANREGNINEFDPNVSTSPYWIKAIDSKKTTGHNFIGISHMTANVIFHKDNSEVTVERRYEDKVFGNDQTYDYTFQSENNQKFNDKLSGYAFQYKASPTEDEMKKDGYLFLGWIDKNSVTEDEFEYIYGDNGTSSSYITTDAGRAIPYLLAEDSIVTEPMDLYPVYVKTAFTTTTNVKESGVDGEGEIGLPIDPEYNANSLLTNDGYTDITFKVDNDQTNVIKNDESKGKYQFKYLEYFDHEGNKKRVTLDENTSDTVTIRNILLGPDYKFIAYYEPFVLTYHTGKTQNEYEIRNTNEFVGYQPAEKMGLAKENVFIGWTIDKPDENYWGNAEGHELITEKNTVKGSMEFWPVFEQAKIIVESNIDDEVTNPSEIRDWIKTDSGYSICAKDSIDIGNKHYTFIEWQKKDADGVYKTLSKDSEFPIQDVLSEHMYKAVYDESYSIKYHGIDGNIIYTANASKNQNPRSFVHKIDEKEAIIDTEAFVQLNEQLKNNDILIQWQWSDGENLIDWNQFYNKTITSDMELYPVVYSFSSLDNHEKDYLGISYTRLSHKQESNGSSLDIPTTIYAYMKEPYVQPKVTVVAKEYSYKNGKMDIHPLVDKEISLQVASENMQINDDTIDNPYLTYEEKNTDDSGRAVFEFTGTLNIMKNLEGHDKETNEVFIFKITDEQDNVLEIPVKGNESIRITMPCGKYKIEENEDWSWRYELQDRNIGNVNEDGTINVIPYHKIKEKKIEFTNKKVNDKWFSDNDRRMNVFEGGSNS